ncbi:MAG: hypothetical protein JXA78_19320 [Anaerolineales bacterium]|nr:hypothetical protein [Anaerolineales bacterium]
MKVRTDIKAGQGLGDVVADITRLTKIDQLAQLYEEITGLSCGCQERRRKLNQLFPLTDKPA